MPETGVNEYMEILVKETATLHKVLSRYLAPIVVEVRTFVVVGFNRTDRTVSTQYVMTQVFAAINHRLSEKYTTIELPNQEAKERLIPLMKNFQADVDQIIHLGCLETPSICTRSFLRLRMSELRLECS